MADLSRSSRTAADLDTEFGFQRPELGKEVLVGTVEFHERHVFLCYKGPEEWPSNVEATESGGLPRLLAAAIEARKSDFNKSTILTICEGEDGTESSLGNVLIFPDMIRYRGLTHSDVDNFVEDVLVRDIQWATRSPEAMTGSYVFVCADGRLDKRCGVCGPALITKFKEEIEEQFLEVAVSACSDAGPHKFAGHIIIFCSNAQNEITGQWYGYVDPSQVPVLLHKQIQQGKIVDYLWRGQMGMSEKMQERALVCALEQEFGSADKLLVPAGFNRASSLDSSSLHGFRTAGQLKDTVNKTEKWLSTKISAALLTNGARFVVEPQRVRDKSYVLSGAVCVLRNGVKIPLTEAMYTTRTVTEALPERQPNRVPIGGIAIIRCDMGGNRWILRKFSIEGDDRFYILQWRRRKPDDEYDAEKSAKKTENEGDIGKAVQTVQKIKGMTRTDQAKAIILLKAEQNQKILATIKSNDLRRSWLCEEIKDKERTWERGEGNGP